jgi:sulfite exporter TauE/SafE
MDLLGLLGAALALGLTGGVHCLAMCTGLQQAALSLPALKPGLPAHDPGPPVAGKPVGRGSRAIPIISLDRPRAEDRSKAQHALTPQPSMSRLLQFHAGRLLGYALLGAAVAGASSALRLGADWAGPLRTVWVLLNAAVLSLGLALALRGAMPAWIDGLTHRLWHAAQSRGLGASRLPVAALGMSWALLPCGLLGGALALALLASDAPRGAAVMASFGLGTAFQLIVVQSLLGRLLGSMRSGHPAMQDLGVRLSGLLLSGMAAMALWAIAHGQPHPFCAS